MAERIESGRMQIAGVGGAPMQRVAQPGVDYVGARAQAQTSSSLAQVLDRMSQYAFGEAKRLRADEGMQYVANNPPTPEQLQAAINGDPSSLIPSGDFTYFDQAVRKARSFQLSAHFEAEGMNELNRLLAEVNNGTATTEQVEQKIATMTQGFATTLSKVEPEAALKFRATMATHGNTVLNSAYTAELKRRKDQDRAKFDMMFDNTTRLLEEAVTQHPMQLDGIVEVYRSQILNSSLLLGDAAIQREYSTKFETALRNAKINAVTKHLVENMIDPVETQSKIRNGDAGTLSPVLQQLIAQDFDAVADITAKVMVASNQREAAIKQKREADKRADFQEFLPLFELAVAAPEGSQLRADLTNQISAIAMRDTGAVPLSIIKELREPSKEGNQMVEFNVLNGIYDGRITSAEQIAETPGLNSKQKLSLLKTLNSEDRRDQAELDRGIARLAGIPTQPGQITVIDPKGAQFQRFQELRADVLNMQATATREGKILTPRQILLQLEKDLEARRNTAAATAAKTKLENVFEKRPWINGPINDQTLSALKRKAGNDPNKLNDIKRIEALLDTVEGRTNAAQ